ncbi:MAG TPA: response regulator [Ruminiclostridium sp.]
MYKVMIVDDEPSIIRNIKRTLERCSNNFVVVAEAYNGCEALEKTETVKPDIIFSDIKMPVMDALTLTKKLNELYPEILPVIISGV